MKAVVYGAGKNGELFCNHLEMIGYEVLYFIDQYTSKVSLCKKHIHRVADIVSFDKNDLKIFNSVGAKEEQIEKTLMDVGFVDFVSFENSFNFIPKALQQIIEEQNLWYDKENLYHGDIERVKKLFDDKKSVKLLEDILAFRKELVVQNYITPISYKEQYLPNDIDIFNGIDSLRFIDCGGFVGDTISAFVEYAKQNEISIDTIVSFEADTNNIVQLNNEIKKIMPSKTKFMVYPLGVYSTETTLYFSNDGNSASAIVSKEEGTQEISVVSLDNTVYGLKPNYIKMDIEGAELEALKGAEKIIKDFKPLLAISIYHKPQDLWEIPLFINSLNKDYKFYIRVYGHLLTETILYCV